MLQIDGSDSQCRSEYVSITKSHVGAHSFKFKLQVYVQFKKKKKEKLPPFVASISSYVNCTNQINIWTLKTLGYENGLWWAGWL